METGRQEHVEYCLDRLHSDISGTTRIRDTISSAMRGSSDAILLHYRELLDELISHLRRVNVYLDGCLDNTLSASVAYRPSVIQTHRRGRPRFNVTVDQLTVVPCHFPG